MITFALYGAILASALAVAILKNSRKSIVALWLTGLATGSLMLKMGAEVLALVQWMSSTVLAITLIYFANLFGEFHLGQKTKGESKEQSLAGEETALKGTSQKYKWSLGAVGAVSLLPFFLKGIQQGKLPDEFLRMENTDLFALGAEMVRSHLLAVEVVGMLLLLAVVGGGILARSAQNDEGTPEESRSVESLDHSPKPHTLSSGGEAV